MGNTDSVFSALVAGEAVDYDRVAKDDAKCRAIANALLHGRPADNAELFDGPRVISLAHLPKHYRHLETMELPKTFEDLQVCVRGGC